MGEIAEDCYDRAMEELGEQEDAFHGVGPERPYYSLGRDIQVVGRPKRVSHREMVAQRNLNLTPPPNPENRDWKFITIEKTWPFGSRDFLVQQPDLKAALKDFYTNEYHSPFRNDKPVPDYHIDVQIQTTGGWIVYGETQTVLIFCR
ncbi:hypothetical protein D3C75_396360 [compost metagenome]